MRKTTFVLITALLLAACNGSPEVYEVPPGGAAAAGEGADGELILPEPIPAAPAYSVRVPKPLGDRDLERLSKVQGVAVASPVRVRRVPVKVRKKRVRLRVGAVESLEFRAVAPPAMRDADFVWMSLITGDAVVTFAAADRLGLRPGEAVNMPGVGPVAVGAWSDNGRPAVADILVDEQHLEALGAGPPRLVLVGAKTGVTLETLGRDIKKVLPRARLRRLTPTAGPDRRAPAPRVVTTTTSTSASITGLHPTLSAAVQQLIAASGGRVWLVSGYRSTAHQQLLWQAALARYGSAEAADNWVAPPGSSNHERGLAVDLGGDLEYAAALAARLKLPLWRPMSWEPWHFELIGSRG
ncbi:MAG TPA: D-alanyl-D-alanine carboxypeptidase family protein [Actinomycetota bacterium]|jgi:hypothetical protein|nr:D-alanyl-D-alanine carboxypeptidase family protein [Actinomycetota bacterium]